MISRRLTPRYRSRTDLTEQVETLQLRLEQLERTLSAIATDAANVSVAGPCTKCQRSLLLMRDGVLECPACGYRRPL
ncbi:hypothetical protein ACFOZ7_16940 [Natribaculum luteum]|uniref:Uncharacterized protein n=1 Tax=Natribaculum luteum TaxID=1586232 RepID=A0ABD5P2X0_9EURY|nr:hypothetical protein [Natribaculum luteum]